MFNVQTTDQKHPVGQVEQGKALVYFFVDFLTAPTMRVGVDGNWMGANNGKSYFFFPVEPGEHNVCAEWQSGTFKKSSERVGEAIHLDGGGRRNILLTAELQLPAHGFGVFGRGGRTFPDWVVIVRHIAAEEEIRPRPSRQTMQRKCRSRDRAAFLRKPQQLVLYRLLYCVPPAFTCQCP